MKKLATVLAGMSVALFAMNLQAADNSKECETLKDEYNIIYASKYFCFKDPEAKAKYGVKDCREGNPKFNKVEQQRLDDIKKRQKELNCK